MPLITPEIKNADKALEALTALFVVRGINPREGIALMAYLSGSNAASNCWNKSEVLDSIYANFKAGWDDENAEQAEKATKN